MPMVRDRKTQRKRWKVMERGEREINREMDRERIRERERESFTEKI